MIIKGEMTDAQLELFTTAARPAAGKKGRKIFDTDLGIELVDNGTAWEGPFDVVIAQFDSLTPSQQGVFRSRQHAVGDMMSSFLSEAQFQAEYDAKWVLCDGRAVSGSDYETITANSSIPDTRGVFMRGKNNSRADGKENPDGDSALGAYQADEFASHFHSFSSSFGSDGTNKTYGTGDVAIATTFSTNSKGGNETRAKNVTVNYFIKINR